MSTTATCDTSTTAFADYGIDDGTDLVHRTRYRLLDRGVTGPGSSPALLERVGDSFEVAFLAASDLPAVPEAVDAAVDDAVVLTARGVTDPEADLRYDVLPAFYRTAAGLACTYREEMDTAAGVEFRGPRG